MPRHNGLWAVIDELRAELKQVEGYYEEACINLGLLENENDKLKEQNNAKFTNSKETGYTSR